MRNLLSANLRRLRKDKYLWVTSAVCLAMCLFGSLESCHSVQLMAERGLEVLTEDYFFNMVPILGLSLAVFASLFSGTEHADGTLRNKLTVGRTRNSVYLASFFTCLAGSQILLLCWFLGSYVFLPLSGLPLKYGWGGIALMVALLIGTQAVFSAIFTWIGNLCTNKALTVVYTLLVYGAILILSSGLYDRLCEPEFTSPAIVFVDGALVSTEGVPNPLYLSGSVREICLAALELLPTGQGILIANVEVLHPVRMLAFSIMAVAVLVLLGMLHFQKKDLK